jgi:hypothetical protein
LYPATIAEHVIKKPSSKLSTNFLAVSISGPKYQTRGAERIDSTRIVMGKMYLFIFN